MAHAESLLLGNKEQNKCKTNQSIKRLISLSQFKLWTELARQNAKTANRTLKITPNFNNKANVSLTFV
jgi:hypothetical protein